MSEKKNKVEDLIFDDKNFNKGTEYGKELMNKSLSKFGAGRSILIDKNNRIIAGNKTTENFAELGLEDVQIVETDGKTLIAVRRNDIDLDTPEGREFALADNTTAKVNIDFDFGALESELESDVIEEWGIEIPDEEVLEAEEDDFDTTPPEEPKTVLGDLYEIGEHRLLCGDSTDSDQVAKLMNGQKSELLFTSPPYSDMREYNGEKDLSVDNIIEFIPAFLSYAEYQVINLGIQRKDHNIVSYWDDYIQKAKDCAYKFLSWNIWARPSAGSVGNQSAFFPIQHEWVFVFGKNFKDINRTLERKTEIDNRKTRTTRQKDGSMKTTIVGFQGELKQMGTVLFMNPELGSIRKLHPATFPIEFPSEYIKAMTNEGDIISEPFTGSGTTMVAAHQLKRKCYGMELDTKYCDVIVKRMLKLDDSITLKRNGVVIDRKEFTGE